MELNGLIFMSGDMLPGMALNVLSVAPNNIINVTYRGKAELYNHNVKETI